MHSVLLTDLEEFVHAHRPHGRLVAGTGAPGPNGSRLAVRCDCGVVLGRWITRADLDVEMVLLARWN